MSFSTLMLCQFFIILYNLFFIRNFHLPFYVFMNCLCMNEFVPACTLWWTRVLPRVYPSCVPCAALAWALGLCITLFNLIMFNRMCYGILPVSVYLLFVSIHMSLTIGFHAYSLCMCVCVHSSPGSIWRGQSSKDIRHIIPCRCIQGWRGGIYLCYSQSFAKYKIAECCGNIESAR